MHAVFDLFAGSQRTIQPLLPPEQTQTFHVQVPARCWRRATCAQVKCPHYLLGWQTILSEAVPEQARLAYMIRHELRLKYTETREPNGLAVFTFEAGQQCFGASRHKVRADVMEDYLVTGGDHRGNPRGEIRRHARSADWVEHCGEHLDKIRTVIERG